VVDDIVLKFFVILAADIPRPKGSDLARIFEGAFRIDVGSAALSEAACGGNAASATDSDFVVTLSLLEDESLVQAAVTPKAMARGKTKQIFNQRG